ncbi:hypothetical protein V8C37DRAFT_387200 [Trichoderma ceciliae]
MGKKDGLSLGAAERWNGRRMRRVNTIFMKLEERAPTSSLGIMSCWPHWCPAPLIRPLYGSLGGMSGVLQR